MGVCDSDITSVTNRAQGPCARFVRQGTQGVAARAHRGKRLYVRTTVSCRQTTYKCGNPSAAAWDTLGWGAGGEELAAERSFCCQPPAW